MNPWTWLGTAFLLLGGIGLLLPLLPTTPFVLLAAACFARSSPRAHRWLLENRWFGPLIQDWEQRRCIPLKVRNLSLTMMTGFGAVSILFLIHALWLKLLGVALIAIGCTVVMRLPVCRDC
ncbi:Protein of unknown function DUF454 [gamma proteobacterium HdN1]|nr:Protein of unknown function DUF454 [gamma proteobacterium HdN1]